jgi:hypothetical protein
MVNDTFGEIRNLRGFDPFYSCVSLVLFTRERLGKGFLFAFGVGQFPDLPPTTKELYSRFFHLSIRVSKKFDVLFD